MRGKSLPDYSHNAEKMELIEYVEQFLTALNFPLAYDWKQQPARWRQAMTILSMTWEIGRLQLTRTAYEK